ncbi:MAG: GAF domain-containing protein [Myxococcota bacterium]|nr:GAF domain-containing protein [Myxococcota bacterium]
MVEEKRIKHRRYEDRRVALMLAIHEVLFDTPHGDNRDEQILNAICQDFGADRAAFLHPLTNGNGVQLAVTAGGWEAVDAGGRQLVGSGINTLWQLQQDAPGALTLTRVKRPTVFPAEDWDDLWRGSLADSTMALLSVHLTPKTAPVEILWLLQSSCSREWSSQDRDLAEEVAALISRVRDKAS